MSVDVFRMCGPCSRALAPFCAVSFVCFLVVVFFFFWGGSFYISLSIHVFPCCLEGGYIQKKLYMHICDRYELIDLHKYVLIPKIP